MKIGILTYHRSQNFGALFQAIASRRYLESQGHEVYYINYWPEYHRAMYSPFSFWAFKRMGWRGRIYYVRKTLPRISGSLKRGKLFSRFVKEYIQPYYAPVNMAFDVIFYGSDQIWRKQPYINDFNPVYFAHNDYQSRLHIALSASVGILPESVAEKERFKSLLGGFDGISVREQSLLELVKHLGYKAQLTCDPALFLTANQWDDVFPRKVFPHKGYLLLVNYIEESFDIDFVKSLAKSKSLDYICINGAAITKSQEGDLNDVAPLDLFEYIRNADFVCTSSFHALVFSLLYHKRCYVAFKNNAMRAESLLNELGIGDRLLAPGQKIVEHTKGIDYKKVDERLMVLRKITYDYIDVSLKRSSR